jgi:hypothetical protein
MFIPREEVLRQHERLEAVRGEIIRQLMQFPGVVAVGDGVKRVKGSLIPEICIKVTVEKKKDLKEIPESERIPPEILGFKTDVEELTPRELHADQNKYRPLVGGSCIANSESPGYEGTLGCFAKVKAGANAGKVVMLSNWHVLVADAVIPINNARTGQPEHNGCCSCCSCDEVGILVDGEVNDPHLDCAISRIYTGGADPKNIQWLDNVIMDIGYVAGAGPIVSLGTHYSVMAGETVYKRGRTTLFTIGTVSSRTAAFPIKYGSTTLNKTDQMEITPTAPFADFSLPGDSGSAIVNAKNEVVGLLFAGSVAGHVSDANHIDYVLTRLNITINSSLTKTGLPMGSVGEVKPLSELFDSPDWWQKAENQLGRSLQGTFIRELVLRHRKEINGLIRSNREVQIAWQRYSGPAFLNHIARSVRRDHPIPDQIKGVSLQNLLLKMAAVLMRHGGERLVSDLEAHYLEVVELTASGNTFTAWVAAVARPGKIITKDSEISI